MGTNILAENTVLLQIFFLAVYLINRLAFATESLAGTFEGKAAEQHLLSLLQ